MAEFTAGGVYYPTAEDDLSPTEDMELLAKSVRSIVTVPDRDAANAYLDERAGEGRPVSSADPGFVYVEATRTVEVNDGVEWTVLSLAGPWREVANNSGWGAYSDGSFWKIREVGDTVELSQAQIKRASSNFTPVAGQNVDVGYIPEGLRPSLSGAYPAGVRFGTGVLDPCWVMVEPTGVLQVKFGRELGTLTANASANLIQTPFIRWRKG